MRIAGTVVVKGTRRAEACGFHIPGPQHQREARRRAEQEPSVSADLDESAGLGKRRLVRDMNVLKWAWKSTQEKGIVQTVNISGNFVLDLFFDWRYGTDTMHRLDPDSLDARSDNQSHSAPYGATKVRPFLRLLTQLDLPLESNFVDIGAGKGRVLLLAAQYEFRKVIGLEFDGRLCTIARNNVELFRRNHPLLSPIEVIEVDATKYSFHVEDRVFFMYNPFDSFILAQLLDNLRRSLDEKPRPIWLIYNTPKYHDMVKAARLFTSDSFFEIGGNHFRVYMN